MKNKQIYAYVKYKNSSSLWIYNCDETFKVGDIVEAPISNGLIINLAIIKKL